MNWFFAAVRSIGSSFPVAGSLVQFQAELDSQATQERLRRLEDPVSTLHSDVREIGRRIHEEITKTGSLPVSLDDAFMNEHRRGLAKLEAAGYVRGSHSLQKQYVGGLRPSAAFVAYMCAQYEKPEKMDRLFEKLDDSPPGTWLKGAELSKELGLPVPLIRGMFELYEQSGLGLLSKELGTANYMCRA